MIRTNERTLKLAQNPEADYSWMRTNWANATCYVTQTITIKQSCPTCPIQTPFGLINTTL